MKNHRYNVSDRKLIAFELFHNNYTPAEVSKRVGVTEKSACDWYSEWLSYFSFKDEIQEVNKVEPIHYWQTEQEIEESLNPTYTYQGLSREEKAIYNGLL